jgi:hypothetical protein
VRHCRCGWRKAVAALLARAAPRGLHLPSDVFYTFPAHPIPPYRTEAREQNADLMVALARTAAAFASRGYEVFLEGIFGPWFLPVIARELLPAAHPTEYVVLRASLATCLDHVRAREGGEKDHVVRQMHAAFAELGPYAAHAVDTTDRSPALVAEAITRDRTDGTFALDLKAAALRAAP